MSESSETRTIQINSQRIVRSYKDVESHIEFFMTDEKRVMDVPLNNVGLRLVGCISPLANISYLSKEKDAFALTSTDLDNR